MNVFTLYSVVFIKQLGKGLQFEPGIVVNPGFSFAILIYSLKTFGSFGE